MKTNYYSKIKHTAKATYTQISRKMLKILSSIALSLLFSLCSKTADIPQKPLKEWSEPIVLASYNMEVRGNNATNPWEDRIPLMQQLLGAYNFDIIGVQEAFTSQLDDLELSQVYEYIDHSIPGDNGVSRTPILYKKDKFKVVKNGVFWLSESPDDPKGKAWDAPRPRICNWAIFEDKKSKVSFFMVNVHVWHQPLGIIAQEEGLNLLLRKAQELSEGNPIIITGDFNIDQNKPNYDLLDKSGIVRDSYNLTNTRMNASWGTFNGHNFDARPSLRIDHIFVETKHRINVHNWGIITDSFDKKFPADHFPVRAELSFLLD